MRREDILRFARFGLVGLASTGVYFALLLALAPLIPSAMLLAGLCYALAMGLNYLAQSTFTFRTSRETRASRRTVTRFIAMHGGALVFNALAMGALVDIGGASLVPAQVLVTGLVSVSTYVISKRWVYA